MNYENKIAEMKSVIKEASAGLGKEIDVNKLQFICCDKGEKAPKANPCCMYIYSFWHDDCGEPLKIGRDGSKSKNRYNTYHYKPNSTKSTLARSLITDLEFSEKYNINEENITEWMYNNLHRINIEIPIDSNSEFDSFTLELIEAVLHYKYRPIFEGRKDQS